MMIERNQHKVMLKIRNYCDDMECKHARQHIVIIEVWVLGHFFGCIEYSARDWKAITQTLFSRGGIASVRVI